MDYKLHHDKDQGYWVGKVVRSHEGNAMFIQQVGNYYQYKGVALRHLKKYQEG